MTAASEFAPRSLLAPRPGPMTGSTREALNSVFRRICEKNQLTVANVLSQLILVPQDITKDGLRRMSDGLYLVNRGGIESQKLIAKMESLTTLKGLQSLTLQQLAGLKGVGTLSLSRYRKWCGHCFDSDLESELGPYERLLWSIDLVEACPNHKVKLRSTCPICGSGPFPLLTGRDISGRCPKCLDWLGGGAIPLDEHDDSYSKYILWAAQSFSDLLDSPLETNVDLSVGFRTILGGLAAHHFSGIAAHLAAAIRRNRSVVTTWLAGQSYPSWQALCEISFVFQIPLPELLKGDTDCILFSSLRSLPLAVLERITRPRKAPQKRDVNAIRKFLGRVIRGEFEYILTIREVANRLGIHPRWLALLLPKETTELSVVLAERRRRLMEQRRASRRNVLREGAFAAVSHLHSSGRSVSRRSVDKELARNGILVRRGEAPTVLGFVKAAISQYEAARVSGNK